MSESFIHHDGCKLRTTLYDGEVMLYGEMMENNPRFFDLRLTRSEAVQLAQMLMKTAITRETTDA